MPPNKKKKNSSKKKAGKKQNGGVPRAALEPSEAAIADSVLQGSIESATAESYATLFSASYPPKVDIDSYSDSLSNKQAKNAVRAYSSCSEKYNKGIKSMLQASDNPGPTSSRWHLAITAFLDAIDSAMKAQNVFLKTTGGDHRNLLCKVCLSIAQCHGRILDAKGLTAWSLAAIAADPTYYNGFSQLSMGLQYEGKFGESLEAAKKSWSLKGDLTRQNPRIPLLEDIVNAKAKSKEWKKAVSLLLIDKRNYAMQYWQEANISRPKHTCDMCWWGGESHCSKCFTVRYCSNTCQVVHYSEHKHNCIATGGDGSAINDQVYPKPDYPEDEWVEDQHWEMFKISAAQLGMNMVQCGCNSCHVGTVKRALMQEGGMKDINKLQSNESPLHRAALRNEPNAAVEIFGMLLKHGACPNVIRCDGVHMLDICRGRARWIDDSEPSMGNLLFRMPYQLGGSEGLEEVERKESSDLVKLVKEAIKNHAMCKLCKRQKARRVNYNDYATSNMTDEFLKQIPG